jgi:hypothetical protein
MFFIFGFGRRKVHDHGPVVACTCPRCHNTVDLSLLHVSSWFTLFFIPVIPYSRKRILACPICHWTMPVSNESTPAIDEMAGITRAWRSGEMSNDDYEQRIQAFWAHVQPAAA